MEGKEDINGAMKLCCCTISVGVLLMIFSLQGSHAVSMEEFSTVVHGLSREPPLKLSPSAVDFFSPDIVNFSPPLHSAHQQHQPYLQQQYDQSSFFSSFSSQKNVDYIIRGAMAGIVLGVVVFGVVYAGRRTYSFVTRRFNMRSSPKTIFPGP